MRIRLLLLTFVTLLLAACNIGATPPPPLPTHTPVPTFTPTTEVVIAPVDPGAAATARAAEEQATAAAQAATTNTQPPANPQPEATQPPAQEPAATDTPIPTEAAITVSSAMNVRGGPGTNYNVIGSANAGQRFVVTGKNPAGDWWQINFNGQAGWVFSQLVTAENTGGVQVATNIPAAPAPTSTPIPAPTNTPAPAQPTAVPASRYEFNVALVQRCDPQAAGTWFEGTVFKGGQPANGYRVVFSYSADGPQVTNPQISGPHDGYSNWNPGYYSHIISAAGPIPGNWYVWLIDANGNRISDFAQWTSGGTGGGCNQAVVDFDSR